MKKSLLLHHFLRPKVMFFGVAVVGCILMVSSANAQVTAFEDPQVASSVAATSDLVPREPEKAGGNVPVGGSIDVINLFRNATSAAIDISSIEILPSANVTAEINTNRCTAQALEPGVECAVAVTVTGNGPGPYNVNLLVNHNARSRLTTVVIRGEVSSDPNAAVTGTVVKEIVTEPELVDFGSITGRGSLIRSVILRNTSGAEIDIEDVRLEASKQSGYSIDETECEALSPNQACVVSVKWSPRVNGKALGGLVIRHSGTSARSIVILQGEYQPDEPEKADIFPDPVAGMGRIIADQDRLDFGSDVDGAASITVSIINDGDEAVAIDRVRLAGSDNGLSIGEDGCAENVILEEGQGCPLTINWLPRREGPIIDDVQILHDGVRGVLVLPIRGEAVQPVADDLPVISSSRRNLPIPPISGRSLNPERVGGEVELIEGGNDSAGAPVASSSSDSSEQGNQNDNARLQELLAEGIKTEGDKEADDINALYQALEFLGPTGNVSLDGYRVTSLASNRAVIRGPRGRVLVRDGDVQMIAGVRWIPQITSDGVELIGSDRSILLPFDRSLAPATTEGSIIQGE